MRDRRRNRLSASVQMVWSTECCTARAQWHMNRRLAGQQADTTAPSVALTPPGAVSIGDTRSRRWPVILASARKPSSFSSSNPFRMVERLRDAPTSIRRRWLDAFDHHERHRASGRFKFQPQLFLDSREDRWRSVGSVCGRQGVGAPGLPLGLGFWIVLRPLVTR